MIFGEIGIKIKNIYSERDFIRPGFLSVSTDGEIITDLCLIDEEGARLTICGKNDWAKLATKLLQPIYDEAIKIIEKIEDEIYSTDREAGYILVGTNDKRILDVYYRGECEEVDGIPVRVVEEQADYCSVAYKI